MAISLHLELKKLHEAGVLELRRERRHLLEGEGAYYHKGHKISIEPACTGSAPGNPDFILEVPHDVAWCKQTNTVLAAVPAVELEEDV